MKGSKVYGSVYVHNIKSLINYAKNAGINLEVPAYVQKNALMLSDWEVGSRYDIHFSVRISVLEKCFQVISAWYASLYEKGFR